MWRCSRQRAIAAGAGMQTVVTMWTAGWGAGAASGSERSRLWAAVFMSVVGLPGNAGRASPSPSAWSPSSMCDTQRTAASHRMRRESTPPAGHARPVCPETLSRRLLPWLPSMMRPRARLPTQ